MMDQKSMQASAPESRRRRPGFGRIPGRPLRRIGLGLGGLAIVGTLLIAPRPAEAQIECVGSGCQFIPITPEEYQRIYYEFQNQYANDLIDKMAEAAVLANVGGPSVGTVNLYGYTAGAQGSLGYRETEEKDVNIPGVGSVQDVPSAGAAVNGRFFLGANLGALLSQSYDPYDDTRLTRPGWFDLSRFDVYVSGLRHSERLVNEYGVDGILRARFETRGIEVRYHLYEGREIWGGPLLRWYGVSVGLGYNEMKQNLDFVSAESERSTLALDRGTNLLWDARNLALFSTSIKTYPLEAKTGVQLFYLLNLTAAVGLARSEGHVDTFLNRSGSLILESNQAQLLGLEPPQASLFMSFIRRASPPRDLYYLKAGAELNIFALKIGVEGVRSTDNWGANVAIRAEL